MTRKPPETLLTEHKERHKYEQYNRLIKRSWFPIVDAVVAKLKAKEKAKEKITQASCKIVQSEMKE